MRDRQKACYQFSQSTTRREMLRQSACGFGQIALAALASQTCAGPVSRKPPLHLPPRAKRVIFLFMWGGPSQVDFFDPKPRLNAHDGQDLAGQSVGVNTKSLGKVLGSPFRFAQHGEGGVWISELLPHLAQQADRLCVINSMHTEGQAHGEALLRLHTGQANLVRPSVGAWVSYGLGSESDSLPGFITLSPPRGHGGVQNYGSAFLPAIHQGMAIGSAEIPFTKAAVTNLVNARRTADMQRSQLDLIQSLNRQHLERVAVDPRIEGLIANYELAFRLQSTMPAILSLDDETQETQQLYGIGQPATDNFGRQCLLARKFAER
ncbi:MAG TPA: DUF1501 domain-containing protein, partial [Planctomycetaceae bacterium]|nr:DUF1501 domain-containing protein [Planctomycetaceae bacterium]